LEDTIYALVHMFFITIDLRTPKLDVAGSIPVSRSLNQELNAGHDSTVSVSFHYQ
jgi:hypothetical protein